MTDNSLLYSQNAKRGLGKIGQAGVDIGSAATQIGLMALTGNAAGALGAGSEATGALTKGLMAIQQAGQGAYDAEKSGAGEGTQALYGLLQGATGYATEGISNVGALGKVFGNGAADSKLEQASANAISKFIKSKTGRAVANRLATGTEAGLGEALEQNIQDAMEEQLNSAEMQTKADAAALSQVQKLFEPIVKTVDPKIILATAFAK